MDIVQNKISNINIYIKYTNPNTNQVKTIYEVKNINECVECVECVQCVECGQCVQ